MLCHTTLHSRYMFSLFNTVGDSNVVMNGVVSMLKGGMRKRFGPFGGNVTTIIDIPPSDSNLASVSPQADRTGHAVWPAAVVLSEYIAANPEILDANPGGCVELGSGLGLCGITLAKLGCDLVVCTDHDNDLLELVNANAATNGVSDQIKTAQLLWGEEAHARNVVELELGRKSPALLIASDVMYNLDSVPALLRTITDIGARTALLAVKPRHFGDSLTDMHTSEELEQIVQYATTNGLQIELVAQEGHNSWDCVKILALTADMI